MGYVYTLYALLLIAIVLVVGVIWGLDNMITLESSDFSVSTSTVLLQMNIEGI